MGFSICSGRGMVAAALRHVKDSKPVVRLEITGGEAHMLLSLEEALALGKALIREAGGGGEPSFDEPEPVFVPE